MARSLNEAKLIGNVGNDPEVRSTTGGNRVATLSLATSESWKDAKSGEQQERTAWHRLVVWGKLADVVEDYVKKGDRLYVSGRIDYRQWEDKDGQTRYTTEINVRDLIMLGGKREGGEGGNSRDDRGRSSERREKAGVGAMNRANQRNAKKAEEDFEDFPGALADDDDDLPF